MEIELKFVKTHEDAILPSQNLSGELFGDTGYDIFSVADAVIPARGSAVVPVGFKVGFIQPGYWFKVEARSGLGFKHSVQPHFGVIDNAYRGDLGVKLYNLSDKDCEIKKGSAMAQLVVYKLLTAKVGWVEKATDTARGENGFGSSGR